MSNAPQTVIETKNLRSYFSEELARASENQSIAIDDDVAAYLTQLLTEFSNPVQLFDKTENGVELKPLALHYLAALEADTTETRHNALRRLGDIALFISGLFPASLNRKIMDVDYYVAMGGTAYSHLHDVLHLRVFAELADRFVSFVDLLAEIAENSSISTNRDVMRDYEIWLQTGSPRLLNKLRRQGIVPATNNVSRRQH
ncbi:MAG: hypothetical protein ACU84Q_12575 [Gammaproteobacteria bacterium]